MYVPRKYAASHGGLSGMIGQLKLMAKYPQYIGPKLMSPGNGLWGFWLVEGESVSTWGKSNQGAFDCSGETVVPPFRDSLEGNESSSKKMRK